MLQSHAILIRLTKLTETSLIVTWFTQDHGLVKTIARGARRPGSAFAGKLDLFFGADIVWAEAKRGELHGLREVSVEQWRTGLRKSYTVTLLAGYCGRLLEQAVEPGRRNADDAHGDTVDHHRLIAHILPAERVLPHRIGDDGRQA